MAPVDTAEPFPKTGTGPARHRLRREARQLHLVRGDGVVPVVATVDDGDRLTVELARATSSVADLLAERGRLDEHHAARVGVEVARALVRFRERGLVHGDVKPANILLAPDGAVWLADLDATEPIGHPRRRGTPGRTTAAPVAHPHLDVLALAASIVEMATGVVPDPSSSWPAASLRDLGCSPALANVLTTVLGVASPAVDAARLADLLAPLAAAEPPRPASVATGTDPTPTLDFDPIVMTPPPQRRPSRRVRLARWLRRVRDRLARLARSGRSTAAR